MSASTTDRSTPPTIHGSSTLLPLPPRGLRFMGEDDTELVAIGRRLADLLVEFGMDETSSVLDIGSGYGRLALGILASHPYRGAYLGFDILRRHVRWCVQSITPLAGNFRFRRLDIRNARYNASGTIDPRDVRFPARSGSVDICSASSVFTHLDLTTTEHYLAEVERVLRPGAKAVTTWFLFDDQRLPAVTSDRSRFPMRTPIGVVNRTAFPEEPLRAIGYEEGWLRAAAARAGLSIVTLEHGRWDGGQGRTTQDLVVFRREGPLRRRDAILDAVAATRWALAGLARRLVTRGRRIARRPASAGS